MAKDKVKVEFKVLKQSAEVGGKYYGIIDNSNPVNPTLTMQQIIDYKKLHNWSASQLGALVEDVLQGAAELVARDGQPRNLSSLLKFEARIKGTFANPEAAVTSQNVYVSPRMLKDIKATLDKSDFEFSNTNDSTDPKISAVTLESEAFTVWNTSCWAASQLGNPLLPIGDLSISGTRLAPSGWTEDCSLKIEVKRGMSELVLCRLDLVEAGEEAPYEKYGCWQLPPNTASLNAVVLQKVTDSVANLMANAWKPDAEGHFSEMYQYTPQADDRIYFTLRRKLGGADVYTEAVKGYPIVA